MTDDERKQVKNQTIEELCNWLATAIEHVDHDLGEYKFGLAMIGGMRNRKEP